jgi:hypothetical protein
MNRQLLGVLVLVLAKVAPISPAWSNPKAGDAALPKQNEAAVAAQPSHAPKKEWEIPFPAEIGCRTHEIRVGTAQFRAR